MTPIYAGLRINTPHGAGIVEKIRNDGMIVARLAGINNGAGAAEYMGYFHPSSVCAAAPPLTSCLASAQSSQSSPFSPLSFIAGAGNGSIVVGGGGYGSRSGSSFLPPTTAVPPPGAFKPVSPEMGMNPDGGVGDGKTVANHPLFMPSLPLKFLQNQQQLQQQQRRAAQDRPYSITPPPNKRRRSTGSSTGSGFAVHH